MNTTDTRPCGGCGEPASAHPVVLDQGDRRCTTYEPTPRFRRLAFTIRGVPKPIPTLDQELALRQIGALNEALDANLRARRELFASGAAVNERLHSTMRIGDTSADPEALIYALGSFKSFVPKELSDANGRRWHLVLEPESPEDASRKGFAIFRELGPNDDCVPSEELLELLRGGTLSIDGAAALQEKRNSDMLGEVRKLVGAFDNETTLQAVERVVNAEDLVNVRGAFAMVWVELFPDAPDELHRIPLEDATTSCIGRIKSLRQGDQESARAAIEIANRSRDLAAMLRASSACTWKEMLLLVDQAAGRLPDVESARDEAFRMRDEAIARLEKIQGEWSKANTELNTAAVERDRARQERDNARAQLEAQLLTVDQTTSLAYALGCERVGTPRLGDTMIAVATALKKDAKEHGRVNTAKSELGAALGIDDAGHTWDGLLDRVRDLARPVDEAEAEELMRRKLSNALGLARSDAPSWDDLLARAKELAAKPGRFATPSHVLLEERLAKLERTFDGWGPNEMLFGKVSDPEAQLQHEAQARHLGTLDALIKSVEARLADVEARIGQPGPLDALEARLDVLAETHERWKSTVDALSARVTELHKHHENNAVESQRRDEALTERIDALEAWQRAATERLGDPTQPTPDPWSKVPVAETNRARPGEGQFVHLQDLQVGDWIALDGVPREVIWLSPEAVVVGLDGVRRVHLDRSGPALRLIWRPSAKEHRRG